MDLYENLISYITGVVLKLANFFFVNFLLLSSLYLDLTECTKEGRSFLEIRARTQR